MITAATGTILIFVTGHVIRRLLNVRFSRDPISAAAIDMGIGLSAWPLLLLWTSLIGVQIGPGSIRSLVACLCLVLVVKERSNAVSWKTLRERLLQGPTVICFGIIAAASVWTRALHVRDLSLPPWVDSIHHMMIIRLIVEQGMLPVSYEPYIADSSFYYHWGYHATTAVVVWLTGQSNPFEISRVMIDFGQALNALTVFPMYAAGRWLFRSQRAGLWAAALATLVSWFPAYYVSWGRYTHLCGVLLLPILPMVVSRMRIRRPGSIFLAAIMAAGLALIHVRLAFFAGTALLVLMAVRVVRKVFRQRMQAWGLLCVLTVLLAGPWLMRLIENPYVHNVLAPPASASADWDTPTGVRTDLAWVPHNQELLILGTGGIAGLVLWSRLDATWRVISIVTWLGAMLLSEIANRRNHSWRRMWLPTLAILSWVLVTAVALNLQVFGLPRLRIASNTSAVITLFVPICLALAGLIAATTETLLRRLRSAELVTTIALFILSSFAVAGFRDVINPRTVLADNADLKALRWIAENTAPDSVFMVRSRPWLGRARMGIDGGAWIQVLTGRQSTLPPGLYPWVTSDRVIQKTDRALRGFEDASLLSDLELRDLLIETGVSHIYFGGNGTGVGPDVISGKSFANLVYEADDIKIFALAVEPPE